MRDDLVQRSRVDAFAQAGTATSTRGRGESNSFNVLRVSNREIVIERQLWNPDTAQFGLARTERFRRVDSRWIES